LKSTQFDRLWYDAAMIYEPIFIESFGIHGRSPSSQVDHRRPPRGLLTFSMQQVDSTVNDFRGDFRLNFDDFERQSRLLTSDRLNISWQALLLQSLGAYTAQAMIRTSFAGSKE